MKAIPRLQMCGNCLVRASKTNGGTRKRRNQTELLIGPTPHAGLATIPSSSLRVGSVRGLDSLCQWDRNQTTGEPICCIVDVTSKDILDQNAHILCEDGTSWCRTCCPRLRNDMTWPFQNLMNTSESETFKELVNSGLNQLGRACIQYLRVCFASGSLGQGQGSALISGLRRYVLLAPSCGADLEDHQSVFRTLWRVHRSWPLAIPAEFSTPRCPMKSCSMWRRHLGFTTSPNFPFCHSFHFIACCVRPRPDTFDGATCKLLMDPCQHVTKKFVNIDQPKVRRMAGRAAEQQVLVECVGIGQTVHSLRSSIPITDSMQQFGLLPHHTDALQINCRPSPCSRRARASYFRRAVLQKPTTSPCNHHGATERVEEFTPFCTPASSNGALPTPSGLSGHYPLPLSDVGREAKGIQTTHTIRAQSHKH